MSTRPERGRMGELNQKKKIIQYSVIGMIVCLLGCGYSISRGISFRNSWEEQTEDAVVFQTTEMSETEESEERQSDTLYCVYVCGAVQQPGVYELPAGSRIYAAVEAAGGLTEGADELAVNLAGMLTDGCQIYIPLEGEVPLDAQSVLQESTDGLVNLNTATKSQLMTLPGIGEARAEAILVYRETVGEFSCIEDVMKVSGIKNALFEQIRMLIKV